MSIFAGVNEVSPPYYKTAVDKNIPLERIYGSYEPDSDNIEQNDINALATGWLAEFNNALASVKSKPDQLDKFFLPHTVWKDHLSLQLDLRDFLGPDKIKEQLTQTFNQKIGEFQLDKLADYRYPTGVTLQTIHDAESNGGIPVQWIYLYLKYENDYGSGRAAIRLVSVKDADAPVGLKALAIYTSLNEFASVPENVGKKRPEGTRHGENIQRKTWLEKRFEEQDYKEDHQPLAVIVGGGQGGLTLAARLKAYGYNVLVVDSNLRVGDNWRKRYKFLALHDPYFIHKLPYLHSDTAPIYPSKDQFANYLECWSKILELNILLNSTVTGATFDKESKYWEVSIVNNSTNEIKALKPKHLVFATGHSGEANIPKFPGQEEFQGEIVHSSRHTSGANYAGKKAVIVGACNSAHDIAQDFYEQGAKSVTMIQRSSTCIISVDEGNRINYSGVFDGDGPDIDTADILLHSTPLYLTNLLQQQQYRKSSALDKKLLDSLEAKGFHTNAGMGGTGLYGLYYRRGSGYYIDVGCSTLIAEGKIGVNHGNVKKFLPRGIELDDGTVIDDVDIIVLATGYSNMKETARKTFGDTIADKLNPVWNLDDEGEFKTIWRDSGHENFWYQGGNLAFARYFSKRLALQIIAQEEGFN